MAVEEPIIPRLDRLDLMLRHLEEIRGCNRSERSSYASTPTSGTLTSDGGTSSFNSSPKSLEKHCRPIDEVIMETEIKGSLFERLVQVELRVLQLCLQLEEEEKEGKKKKKRGEGEEKKERKKKGLKQMVKSCMKGNSKTKH